MGNKINAFLNGIAAIGEAVIEAAEREKQMNKDNSESRVRYQTGSIKVANIYRQLINEADYLSTKDKEVILKELAIQFRMEDRIGQQSYNESIWTQEEVKAFDEGYNLHGRGERPAENIKIFYSSRLRNKSLLEINERVQRYKNSGL